MSGMYEYGYWAERARYCTKEILEAAGLPKTACVAVSNSSINDAVYIWLSGNWTTNWTIINYAGELLTAYEDKFLRVPVKRKSYLKIAHAFGKFCMINKAEIMHLYNTLGNGANANHPVISKAFDKMSYPERKALMRAKQASLEEVKDDKK